MSKQLRADAARNRTRVLQVARETFAAEGLDVPIDEIARRAGVGAGTVYRHFPTKEALFLAIMGEGVGQVVEQARALLAAEAGAALYRFLQFMIEQGAANQGLVDALANSGVDIGAALPELEREFRQALADLVEQGQRAGTVRSDVDASDVKTLLVGLQAMRRFQGAALGPPFQVVRDGLAPPHHGHR